jgi:hypothetical protein
VSTIFKSGIQAVREEASHSGGGDFALYLSSLLQAEGDQVVIRHLTDMEVNPTFPHIGAIIQTRIHQGVPSRPRPEWLDKDDPWWDNYSGVCRNTKIGSGQKLWEVLPDADEYRGCWICDHVTETKKGKTRPHYASVRAWGLCVVRNRVQVAPGEFTYVDATREVTRDEQTIQVPDVRIMQFGMKNFWSKFDGTFGTRGTLLDWDFVVTRKGSGTDTDYTVGQTADPVYLRGPDGNVVLSPNGSPLLLDYRDPAIYSKYQGTVDLDEPILHRAGIDYHRRRFDASYTPADVGEGAAPASTPAPVNDVASAEALGALSARLDGYTAPAGAPVPGQVPGQPQ